MSVLSGPAPLLVPMHGIGARRDLPLPFEYVVAGAAVVLIVTFVLLLWAWRDRRYEHPRGLRLPRLTAAVDHPVARTLAGLASWFVLAWFLLALIAGQDRLTNPAFGFVFACVWVGLVPLSLLGGRVWHDLQPFHLLPLPAARRPDAWWRRIGVYPAAAALACFAWLELLQPGRATQPVLLGWTVAWLLWVGGGTVVFGRRWVAAADPFTCFAGVVAWLSPWQRIDGTLHLVNPLRHLATVRPARGTWAVVSVLLGATAFDSWSGGAGWVQWVQTHRLNPLVIGAAGLAGCVGVVALTLWLGVRGMRPWLRPDAEPGLFDRMAATVTPLVAGYAIGHYATLLAIEGQRTLINASDPLGRGWNVFGTAELGVGTALFDHPAAVATLQAASIVVGHVLGVLAAHEAALAVLRREGIVRGQLALLTVMVAYTCTGLLLLFSA